MRFLIEEEYGYRYWVWETAKSKQEMIAWWSALESVNEYFFNPATSLPFGKVSPLPVGSSPTDMPELEGYLHLHEDFDSFMRFGSEDVHHHKGYHELW